MTIGRVTMRTLPGRIAFVGERLERFELVGGMHGLTLDVLGKADLGSVGFIVEDIARDRRLRRHAAGVHEGFERQEPATPCDDGLFPALVLTDHEGLQKAVRKDGSGQFTDVLVEIGLADIALPSEKLVEGDVDRVGRDMPLWFE
jgi:hypothetical protein